MEMFLVCICDEESAQVLYHNPIKNCPINFFMKIVVVAFIRTDYHKKM